MMLPLASAALLLLSLNPVPVWGLNTTEFITRAGYPAEEHHVVTPDGYILGVQRIPHGRNEWSAGSEKNATRPVVFLQHGLLDCSATWVCNPPSESLGFILADAGYDVWLGNVRGNEYSLGHTGALTPRDDAFWSFSMDEMVELDLPSMLSYVLAVTQEKTLKYVGHSQGTAILMMALAGARGRAAAVRGMISHAVLMGPVAKIVHADLGLLQLLVRGDLFALFGHRSFALTVPVLEKIFPDICKGIIGSHLCEDVIMSLVGWDPAHTNASRMPDYVSFDPAGTSVMNMNQWKQWRESGKWAMYDFGSEEANRAKYGSPFPPEFDPALIAADGHGHTLSPRLFFVSGGRDKLADPADVADLERAISASGASGASFMEIDDYNHLDFLWAENARETIYNKAIAFFDTTAA